MIKNILSGLKAYTGTLQLISKLKLWKYFGVPISISFLVASAVVFAAFTLADNIASVISNLWIWEWGSVTFLSISTFLSGLIILILGFVIYKHTVLALSAPFMSSVSEKIEAHLLGAIKNRQSKSAFAEQLWRGIRLNMRNLMLELLWTLPILVLGLIPVIGIFSAVLLFLVQAYYAGFGNMDYTLERHLNYDDSIKFVKQHRGAAIGNGSIFMLFLLIPVIGILIVLPLSVTAASTQTIRLLKQNNQLKRNDF